MQKELKPFKVEATDNKYKVVVPSEIWPFISNNIQKLKIQTSRPKLTEEGMLLYFSTMYARDKVKDLVKNCKIKENLEIHL